MYDKSYCFAVLVITLLCLGKGEAAPTAYRPAQPTVDPLGPIKVALGELKHEIRNHETEIRTHEDKLRNQESIIDGLREQLVSDLDGQKDLAKAQQVDVERRLDSLNTAIQGIVADMKLMKTQANESVVVLGQYKQKINDLEALVDVQSQHMKGLEATLNSVLEALQAKNAADKAYARVNEPVNNFRTYKVQSGDSLEKIARFHKVSIQSLREANALTDDRIRIGQTLKIPF